MTNKLKYLYYTFVPFVVRIKIRRFRCRKELNVSKKYFGRHETYFKCHIDDFMFDDVRKIDTLQIFSLLRKNGYTTFPKMDLLIYDKYFKRSLIIEKDLATGLYYVLVDNKKLFYKRGMDENAVRCSFNSVSVEQDFASPHRYVFSSQ